MKHAAARFRLLAATALLTLLLASCLSDSVEPTIDLDATPLPGEAITLPSPTPEPEATPTPPIPDWLPSLLRPGPTRLVSPVVVFLNGPDAWLIDGELAATELTDRQRVRAVATTPGAASAAVLFVDAAGGRESEEIRVIDAAGETNAPLYGPEITGDPGGNPGVALLAWSPDGQTLAIVRDDDSVLLARAGEEATPLEMPQPTPNIESIHWSPDSQALALLHRPQGNAGVIRIVPVNGAGFLDISPQVSFGILDWPPQSATLIVGEDRGAGLNPNAGSLFTISPSGDDRELLVSAGEFGPAIRIGKTLSSPDGALFAFTVETPTETGDFAFQSLNVLDLATGISRRIDVAPGYNVTELWWFDGGLMWRSIAAEDGPVYTGIEPFILEVADLETGAARRVFTSSDGG